MYVWSEMGGVTLWWRRSRLTSPMNTSACRDAISIRHSLGIDTRGQIGASTGLSATSPRCPLISEHGPRLTRDLPRIKSLGSLSAHYYYSLRTYYSRNCSHTPPTHSLTHSYPHTALPSTPGHTLLYRPDSDPTLTPRKLVRVGTSGAGELLDFGLSSPSQCA